MNVRHTVRLRRCKCLPIKDLSTECHMVLVGLEDFMLYNLRTRRPPPPAASLTYTGRFVPVANNMFQRRTNDCRPACYRFYHIVRWYNNIQRQFGFIETKLPVGQLVMPCKGVNLIYFGTERSRQVAGEFLVGLTTERCE